jgi:hypothetical protein
MSAPVIVFHPEPTLRVRLTCALHGHQWIRRGSFLVGDAAFTSSYFVPVRRCDRCRCGHPENPEIITLGAES